MCARDEDTPFCRARHTTNILPCAVLTWLQSQSRLLLKFLIKSTRIKFNLIQNSCAFWFFSDMKFSFVSIHTTLGVYATMFGVAFVCLCLYVYVCLCVYVCGCVYLREYACISASMCGTCVVSLMHGSERKARKSENNDKRPVE